MYGERRIVEMRQYRRCRARIRELLRGFAISAPSFLDGNGPSSPDYNSNSIKSRGSLPERITLLQ